MHLLFYLAFVSTFYNALGDVLSIRNESGFIEFAKAVNAGTNYSETTVFLEADLDFSGNLSDDLVPVGANYWNSFLGTFDGQGYIIGNITMNHTSLRYVGLFGYSDGASIKNIILDSSCSIISPNNVSRGRVGGIIGYCESYYKPCRIENNINIASIFFYEVDYFYIGGIIGIGSERRNDLIIKNNVNYGTISKLGASETDVIAIDPGYFMVGGIVGHSSGFMNAKILNNLNYGTIEYATDTDIYEFYIGGIVGLNYYTEIDNCVNYGDILTSGENVFAGSIVGKFYFCAISHCYWNKGFDSIGVYNYPLASVVECSGFDPSTFELDNEISVGNYSGKLLLDALNAASDLYYQHEYSKWLSNKNGKNAKFIMGDDRELAVKSKLILMPYLAREGSIVFDGWYEDSSFVEKIKTFSIENDAEFYGKRKETTETYTIVFDTRGGSSVSSITASPSDFIELPFELTKEGYAFLQWDFDNGDTAPRTFEMPAHNIKLYAVWVRQPITTAEQLIEFSELINSGVETERTSVSLGADIDFYGLSDKFVSIGKEWGKTFIGEFDGKGHTISNLVINTTGKYAGLFGFIERGLIKNIVIDASCSVINNRKTQSDQESVSATGALVGFCYRGALDGIVNMAPVEFSGESQKQPHYIGGIAGYFYSNDYDHNIKHSINFGSVTYSGTSKIVGIGGISGYMSQSVERSANYGTIEHAGKAEASYIGGICGESYAVTSGCLSVGPIVKNDGPNITVGGFFGMCEEFKIISCVWTYDVGVENATGAMDEWSDIIDVLLVDQLNVSVVDELNEDRNHISELSRWIVLNLADGGVNGIKQDPIAAIEDYFPVPEKMGWRFMYWCVDEKCTDIFDPLKSNISEISELYAQWEKEFTVFFDLGNGTVSEIHFIDGEAVVYPPDPVREGYGFVGWDVNVTKMSTYNVTVKAQWVEGPTEYVEIVFGVSNMTESQIRNVLMQYTSDDFTIEKFEVDETTGETLVIIKFVSADSAVKFMRTVNDVVRDGQGGFVRKTKSIGGLPSSSPCLLLLPILLYFIF